MHSTIRIHPLRLKQLRTFGSNVTASAAMAIEAFLSDLMQSGRLPDNFGSAFSADLNEAFVQITLRNYQLPPLDVSLSSELSADIYGVMRGRIGPVARRELPDGTAFIVARAGRGYRFEVRDGEEARATLNVSKVIAFDMARQLAVQTRKLLRSLTGEDQPVLDWTQPQAQ